MDISLETHQSYIGQPVEALPTPALVISKPVLENNVKKLHDDVEQLGIGFRPHVKTLKVYYLQFLYIPCDAGRMY